MRWRIGARKLKTLSRAEPFQGLFRNDKSTHALSDREEKPILTFRIVP
jgi:hypothetical protein